MKLTVELALPSTDPAVPQVRAVNAGQKDWKFSTQLQDGELFYRTKLSGNLTISGDDFAWLYDQYERFPCCVEVEVNTFTANCDTGQLELFWPGYFLMTAVRWDFSSCSAEVREVLPRDGYDALFRVWEKPVNLLEGNPAREPFTALYADYLTTQFQDDGTTSLVLPDGNAAGVGLLNLEHTYPQGLRLNYVFDALLTKTITGTPASFIPGITSSFYFALINPITKRLNGEKVILAGSDAKRPASITPAVKLVVTLKEFLADLKGLHNVYYMLDPQTGHLRLEHYSWFAQRSYANLNRVSLNLLSYPDALKTANNESVDLDSLFGVEELRIENNSGSQVPGFKTGSVRYDALCTVKDDKGETKTNTITVSKIFTDLMAAYRNADSVPDDSIFLAELTPPKSILNVVSNYALLSIDTTDIPLIAPYTFASGIGNNGFQSAATLFREYHRHGRSFSLGLVNSIKQADGSYTEGQTMLMLSTSPTRRQENIVIPICCADLPINLDGYVKTNRFAQGKLDKGTFDPANDTLTLDVVAGSRCQQVRNQPSDPGSGCPSEGTSLGTRFVFTFAEDGTTVLATKIVEDFADGNCGSYELPWVLKVGEVVLNG